MHSTILTIEWIGVFFLSVEAIKIRNIKLLTLEFLEIRNALNPRYTRQNKKIYVPQAAQRYRFLRKYSSLISYIIGILICIIFLIKTGLMKEFLGAVSTYLLIFSDVPWYRYIFNIVAFSFLFIWVPFYLGNESLILFSRFADSYSTMMHKLEKNTFNGIIGLIGFSLMTISFILKLIFS